MSLNWFSSVLLLLILAGCSSPEEQFLILDEDEYWFNNSIYQISPEGEKKMVVEREIKNALDHPNYEYVFYKFMEDTKAQYLVLSDDASYRKNDPFHWALEEDNTKIRMSVANEALNTENPHTLWNLETINAESLVISKEFPNGGKNYRTFIPKKLDIPGTKAMEKVATEASDEAKSRGLSAEVKDETAFEERRKELLSLTPENLNLPYSSSEGAYAMVVEYTSGGETVLVYATTKGNSEVLYSSGIVQKGGRNVPAIKNATHILAGQSTRIIESTKPLASFERPKEGDIRFYIITNKNTGEVTTTIERAVKGHRDTFILHKAMNEMIKNYNIALSTL